MLEINKFIDNNHLVIFSYLVLTLIFPAFAFLNASEVDYVTYLAPYSLLVFSCVALYKLVNRREMNVDAILVFILYFIVNVWIHTLDTLRGFLYTSLYITLYIIFINLRNKEIFFRALKVLVFMGVCQSLIGLSQVLFGVPYYEELVGDQLHSWDRNYFSYFISSAFSKQTILASGTFRHFNTLASFLVLCLPVAYTFWLKSRKRIWLAAFLIISTGTIVTFSRGALMASFLMISFLYLAFSTNRWVKIIIGILVALLVLILASPLLDKYIAETGNVNIRMKTWEHVWAYAVRHPVNLIFGYGFGHLVSDVLTHSGAILDNTHNSFLQMLVELGIAGFLLYVTGFYFLIKNALKTGTRWSYCLIALVVGFSFTQFFDNALFSFNGLLFFVLIALFQSYLTLKDDRDRYPGA